MSRQSTWRSLFLSYLSRPAGERLLYREAIRQRPRTFLELGIGTGTRATRLLEIASWWTAPCELEYTAIDPFESRRDSAGEGTTLKGTYQVLRATGAKVRLLPGTAGTALSAVVGSLPPLDFIVASTEEDLAALAGAIAYFPRFLHADTRVLLGRSAGAASIFRRVSLAEIHEHATENARTAQRAA